jgi:hypothetical protein
MEVYRALLGERLAVLEAEEFAGKTVKSVKQSLATQFPRFAAFRYCNLLDLLFIFPLVKAFGEFV